MSLPEISRRCISCGAAVRAVARFCPQCGHPFEAEAAAPDVSEARASAPPTGEWSSQEKVAPATKEVSAFEQPAVVPEAPPTPEPDAPVVPEAPVVSAPEPDGAGAAGREGDLR